MANLNLSQFTEKTFVADADWTFVWDTAGAISKKVSRNNWLNSGELTTSAPVTISQTWNGTGSTVFTALKVDAVSTASAAASLLLDLQVNGTSLFRVAKNGYLGIISAPNASYLVNAGGPIGAAQYACTSASGGFYWDAANSSGLFRDDNNAVALRNSTAAQTFNVYGTYSSGSAYARLAIACDTSGNATLTTQSTGTAGTVSINGVPVGLGGGNVSSNVSIGTNVLNANLSNATNNVAIGNNALKTIQAGDANGNNTAIGVNALSNSIGSGSFNTAIGSAALLSNYGADNTAVGYLALTDNSTGTKNVALGRNAGSKVTGGSANNYNGTDSVFIGMNTKALAISQTNQIVIGYDATGLGSNTAVLGNASITTTALRGNVGIGTTAPSSRLQVTGGDVEIETVTSGIIMKAAGTSTRYRITLNAGGTALVFTAI